MNMTGAAPATVNVAYISGGFPVWALFVGQRQGLFEARGLALSVTQTGLSVAQMDGLRAGRFDIGLQLPDHVVRATATGCPMVVLAAQTHAPDVALVASPGMADLKGLGGKRIAVDGARTGYALLLRQLLDTQGPGPGGYELVEIGGSQERVDALRQGDVSASFINPPLDRPLIDAGFVRLTSTREAFPGYPGPVAAARRGWMEQNPATGRAFQAAWSDAWRWLLDEANTDAALALATDALKADAGAAQRALAGLRRQGEPHLTADGLQQVIDLVWHTEGLTGNPPAPNTFIA